MPAVDQSSPADPYRSARVDNLAARAFSASPVEAYLPFCSAPPSYVNMAPILNQGVGYGVVIGIGTQPQG